MSAYEFCKTETDGRLLIVTINRPEVMNRPRVTTTFVR